MTATQNIIGARLRDLRKARGLTQAQVAARCGLRGWDATENVITKIEAQIRCVVDRELQILAEALGTEIAALFPAKRPATAPIAKKTGRRPA